MDSREQELKNLKPDNIDENSFGVKEVVLLSLAIIITLVAATAVLNWDKIRSGFNDSVRAFNSLYSNQKAERGDETLPEFTPYLHNLQKHVKSNWSPPSQKSSNSVQVLFKVSKDGRLLSYEIIKSSGIPEVDKAAIDALVKSAPFAPLPKKFRKDFIDVQFTFDYNVFKKK